MHYSELVRGPVGSIQGQVQVLQQAGASISRIQELLPTRSKLEDGEGALPPGPLPVTFTDVSFGYGEEEAVLQEISFRLQPGRVLGLLGRTGSGKTTLARLLLRMYDPDEGEIRLGNVVPSTVRLHHLRQRVSMVTQDAQLFQATVRDNLSFFNPAISDERLWDVLRELGLSGWLRSLPDGLSTELQAGEGGLSAGQAQLLAFARVFLTDPGLVILDEASSCLDVVTEQLVGRAVNRLLENRTGIVIAHRLATVRSVDEVMILDRGRIVEYGDRAQLAGDPESRFHRLMQAGLHKVLA